MQTWSGQNVGGLLSPSRKFLTITLSAFSLAGLIIGFAVGGLAHPKAASTNTTGSVKQPTVIVHATATPPPTATTAPVVVLGFPQFNPFPTSPESAAGGTQYTVSMQAVDKQNKPVVHASDITCKLWLVQQIPAKQILNIDKNTLKAVNNLDQPIQGSINNQPAPELPYLVFDANTKQTTQCNANGQATWKYTISPTAPPGNYELVILADWKGVHYNWYWVDIKLTH